MFRKNLPKSFSRSESRLGSSRSIEKGTFRTSSITPRPKNQALHGDRVIFPQPKQKLVSLGAETYGQQAQLTNKPQRRQIKIRIFRLFLILIILITLGTLGYFAYKSKFWVINTVEFNANWPSLPGLADELRQEYTGKNMLTINTNQKVQELKKNPYIKEVYFQKKIPNTLYIFIQEAKPTQIFISLNKLQLLDQNGELIKEINTTKPLSVTESERLIYITPKVFRNQLLLAKWQSKEESKLREDFNKYLVTLGSSPAPTSLPTATGTASNAPQPTATTSPILNFDEFVAQKFLELNLNDLNSLYQNLRNEVRLAVDTNWEELQGQVSDQNLPIIFSLVEREEVKDDYLLINPIAAQGFKQQLNQRFVVKKIEIISPVLIRVVIDGMADGSDLCSTNSEIYFNLNQDQSLKFKKLDTLLLDLIAKRQKFSKIDLSGEKIVVG